MKSHTEQIKEEIEEYRKVLRPSNFEKEMSNLIDFLYGQLSDENVRILSIMELKAQLKEAERHDRIITKINALVTKPVPLNSSRMPLGEGEPQFYCDGCNRFVIEEGCICGMVDIEEINQIDQEEE